MLSYAGIFPHGSSIIGEIAGPELKLYEPIRSGCEKLGERVKEIKPDTIIVITPHGLRLKGYNAVYTSEYCRGTLSDNGITVSADFKCDKEMAIEILENIEKNKIPVVGANFGALSGEESCIDMDWGTLIPLFFMGANSKSQPELVVIGPTREIPLTELVEMGKIIGNIAEKSSKKVVLIASADQAHAHDPNGIYGFSPKAKEYDEKIISIIKENRLEKLLEFNLDFVEDAKPDSLWQLLILYGASTVVPLKGELFSYQVPTYFGMLAAGFERKHK